MRNLLASLVLGVGLLVGGCAQLGIEPIHKDTAEVAKENPVLAVRQGIDEIDAWVAVTAETLIRDYHENVYTQEEIQNYYAKLNKLVMVVNQAENYLELGNVVMAKDKLQAAQLLVGALKNELIKQKGNN